MQISSERLADELSQLVGALADVLGRVQEGGSGYRLDEVTFEAAFDGRVGLALVGRTGATRVVTLKFVRSSRDLLAKGAGWNQGCVLKSNEPEKPPLGERPNPEPDGDGKRLTTRAISA